MKALFLIFIALSIFCSCNQSELQSFDITEDSFKHLINDKNMPSEPNLNRDKTILNRDYPIEVALYKDGQWFYDLPNLGSGSGTWVYEDTQLVLHAERKIFDMNIKIYATKEEAQKVSMKFFDRHGFKSLELEKINQ